MQRLKSSFIAAAMLCAASVSASAATFFVDAQSDIFLAGQVSVPSFDGGAGSLPPSIDVSAGQTLNISATGIASCCSGSSPSGPGGLGGSSSILGYGNVGSYSGVQFPLAGVFLGTPGTPNPFAIGDSGSFVVPTGATKLYFGLPDAFGFSGSPGFYADNTGGFNVTVSAVPETSTWIMILLGFAGLGFAGYRKSKSAAAVAAA